MSVLQCLDAMSAPDLQIWNNEIFDDGSGSTASKASPTWNPLPAVRTSESLSRSSGKENRSLGMPGPSPASKKAPAPVSKPFPLTPVKKATATPNRKELGVTGDDARVSDHGKIDAEIEEVEKEIGRLSLRLEALRLKKAERDPRVAERRGRIVPAKFLTPKQSAEKNGEAAPAPRKVQESPAMLGRRRASLGPLEISSCVGLRQPEMPGSTPIQSLQDRRKSCVLKLQNIIEEERGGEKKEKERPTVKPFGSKQGTPGIRSKSIIAFSPAASTSVEYQRRGASLGPAEIVVAAGLQRPGKKLQEIKEEEEPKKGKGRSLSSSPKSRQSAAKLPELRKGIATVESKTPVTREYPVPKNLRPKTLFQEVKKPVKREKLAPNSLQPKTLIRQVKKTIPVKKTAKNLKVRMVASRYSLITVRLGRTAQEGKRRQWSLPDNIEKEEEEAMGAKKSRMSLPVVGKTFALQNQGKLKRNIPDGINEEMDPIEASPPSILRIAESLPKIRTARCAIESPRDSGRAKRVAELIGRESHFDAVVEDEDTEPASCENMDLEEGESNGSSSRLLF